MMTNSRRLLYIFGVVFVTITALGLRWRAVMMLPIDYDEDDYLATSQHYAEAIRAGDWNEIINYDYVQEHPLFAKLVYTLATLHLPPATPIPELPPTASPARSLPQPHFTVARMTAAIQGTLEVFLLALLNPLAGLFLAVSTWQIKYTSQVMLESTTSVVSLVAVLSYWRWKSAERPWAGWLVASAMALGLTAASKYVYCLAGVAVAVDWLWATYPAKSRRTMEAWVHWLLPVVEWGVLAGAIFFLVNPRLWADPFERLAKSVLYWPAYSAGAQVSDAGFPLWQPLVWLSGPVPWHPGVFLLPLDLYISIFAAFGLRRLWRDPQRRVFVIWLAIALAFLLWWRTKWPQYILILTAPLSLAAAEGFRGRAWEPLSEWVRHQRGGRLLAVGARESTPDTRRAIPWLAPGLIGLLVLTIFPLIYQFAMSLTDFNAMSIRDGINGGVWREVWLGLTFQRTIVPVELFSGSSGSTAVHFAGPGVLLQLFFGLGSNVLFFNVMWAALSVALQAVLGVSAALMLNRPGVRLRNGWRAIFILPWAIPEFVGALIWLRIFEPDYGWLTQSLPADVLLPRFFDDQNFALMCLLIAATWYGFPLIMLAATAGLKLVPRDVYDAAAIDGAGSWAQLRSITLPLLWPLLAPAIIIRSIFAFNQFYLFWVMQSPFPLTSFATVSYFMFSNFGGGQYAVSAAINIFTVVVLIGLILWFNRASKAGEGVTYA